MGPGGTESSYCLRSYHGRGPWIRCSLELSCFRPQFSAVHSSDGPPLGSLNTQILAQYIKGHLVPLIPTSQLVHSL